MRWRKEAGILSCQYRGVGPTGGFCLDASKKLLGDAGCLAQPLASQLALLFANGSVIDVGAGAGTYGKFFSKHARSVRWVGVDGAENVEEASNRRVRFAEVTEPFPTSIRALGDAADRSPWRWAMSLEVGEHIERLREPLFMHNLASLAKEGVVLSWARLGQGGTAHVNCQVQHFLWCRCGEHMMSMLPSHTTMGERQGNVDRSRSGGASTDPCHLQNLLPCSGSPQPLVPYSPHTS